MNYLVESIKYIVLAALLGVGGYVLYGQAQPLLQTPCTEPIVYSIGTIDPRFGISEEKVRSNVSIAAGIWNRALGKTLFTEDEGGMVITLEYSEYQATTELGKNISAEQKRYNEQKADVEEMKKKFNNSKDNVEALQSSYNAKAQAYQNEVESWNRKGGAPEAEYARLQNEHRRLESARITLNTAVENVNDLADDLNAAVAKLNTLADSINIRADEFNQFAGMDYEQGQYRKVQGKESISIFEFSDSKNLQRVLTHEFGHALGLDHVDNPESIMYAYDIGDTLALTEEDMTALKTICRIK